MPEFNGFNDPLPIWKVSCELTCCFTKFTNMRRKCAIQHATVLFRGLQIAKPPYLQLLIPGLTVVSSKRTKSTAIS